MRRILASKSGFTLIELAISMAILLIVITPLASSFITSTANNHRAELQLEANLFAERYMEEWKRSGVVVCNADGTPKKIDDVPNAAGTLVVKRVATPVDNNIVTGQVSTVVPGTINEPSAPTEKPDPYTNVDASGHRDPAVVMKPPVASAIENYQLGDGTSDMKTLLGTDFTGSFTLDGTGLHDTYDTNDPKIPDTAINISQIGNTLTIDNGTTTKSLTYTDQVSLVFLVKRDAKTTSLPIITVKAADKPMKIYILRGYDANNNLYPEPSVMVTPGLDNVQIFKNLFLQPATVNSHRMYKVDVMVYRKVGASTESPLITLTSYMRIK